MRWCLLTSLPTRVAFLSLNHNKAGNILCFRCDNTVSIQNAQPTWRVQPSCSQLALGSALRGPGLISAKGVTLIPSAGLLFQLGFDCFAFCFSLQLHPSWLCVPQVQESSFGYHILFCREYFRLSSSYSSQPLVSALYAYERKHSWKMCHPLDFTGTRSSKQAQAKYVFLFLASRNEVNLFGKVPLKEMSFSNSVEAIRSKTEPIWKLSTGNRQGFWGQ